MKKLFQFQDLRYLIGISLDLTKKLEQLLGPLGPYMYDHAFFKKTNLNLGTFETFVTSYMCLYVLLKIKKEYRDFQELIYMSLYCFKKFVWISGPLKPHIYLFFQKRSRDFWDYWYLRYMSLDLIKQLESPSRCLKTSCIWRSIFFKKLIWKSLDLRVFRDLTFILLYVTKELDQIGGLRDLRDLTCLSLDITKKFESFSWPSGLYMYDFLFFH